MVRVLQIDPIDCNCRYCASGHHVPLDRACILEIDRMIDGELIDNTQMSERKFSIFLKSKGML